MTYLVSTTPVASTTTVWRDIQTGNDWESLFLGWPMAAVWLRENSAISNIQWTVCHNTETGMKANIFRIEISR
jgi:hypothetical protein